jgi:hypothetical protein
MIEQQGNSTCQGNMKRGVGALNSHAVLQYINIAVLHPLSADWEVQQDAISRGVRAVHVRVTTYVKSNHNT